MDREWIERHNARHIAEQILYRAETDKDFAERAKSDPFTTLTEAGISPKMATEMLERRDIEPGPSGPCEDGTCWITACPGTCFVTVGSIRHECGW